MPDEDQARVVDALTTDDVKFISAPAPDHVTLTREDILRREHRRNLRAVKTKLKAAQAKAAREYETVIEFIDSLTLQA